MKWIIGYLADIAILLFSKNSKISKHLYNLNFDTKILENNKIPIMGFRILKGSAFLYNSNNKLMAEIGPHSTWGMREILVNLAANTNVYVKKNSIVLAIGKSELKKPWTRIFFNKNAPP